MWQIDQPWQPAILQQLRVLEEERKTEQRLAHRRHHSRPGDIRQRRVEGRMRRGRGCSERMGMGWQWIVWIDVDEEKLRWTSELHEMAWGQNGEWRRLGK